MTLMIVVMLVLCYILHESASEINNKKKELNRKLTLYVAMNDDTNIQIDDITMRLRYCVITTKKEEINKNKIIDLSRHKRYENRIKDEVMSLKAYISKMKDYSKKILGRVSIIKQAIKKVKICTTKGDNEDESNLWIRN